MEVQLAVVLEVGPFGSRGFCTISPEPESIVDEYVSHVAMNVMWRQHKQLRDAGGGLDFVVHVCQGLTVYHFNENRFLDPSQTFEQERITNGAVLIVTNVTDEESIRKMIRPATEIEALAWKVRRGS